PSYVTANGHGHVKLQAKKSVAFMTWCSPSHLLFLARDIQCQDESCTVTTRDNNDNNNNNNDLRVMGWLNVEW
ncbi:hypothetical protein THAOC_17384, partial [Thalassiosira oceanica]